MRLRRRRGVLLPPAPSLADDPSTGPVRRPSGLDDATDGLPGDARTHLDQLVEELAAAGALDEGTGDLLDELIESWRAQHHAMIEVYYLQQRDLAEQQAGALRARHARAQHRLSEAERRVALAEAVLEASPAEALHEGPGDDGAVGEVPAPRAPQEAAA